MGLTKVTEGVIKSDIDYKVKDINATGVVTATKFVGDGSSLTGVSGFSTALSSDQSSSLNSVFITSTILNVGAGESVTVTAPVDCGGIAFTRAKNIYVAVGGTFGVSSGTTLRTNVLGIF